MNMAKYTRWKCFILMSLTITQTSGLFQNTSNISADAVEDYIDEHNAENISTETVDDYIYEELMQQELNISEYLHVIQHIGSKNQTLIGIRRIIERLTNTQNTSNRSAESVEDYIDEHNAENISTETVDDYIYEELMQQELNISDYLHVIQHIDSKNQTLIGIRRIIERLTKPQVVSGSRGFLCSEDIKKILSECLKQCKDVSCLLREIKSYDSACRTGTKQTCQSDCSPPCVNGNCVNGGCDCDLGYTGPDCSEMEVQCGIANLGPRRRLKGNPTRGISNRRRPLEPNIRTLKPNRARPSKSNRGSSSKQNGRRLAKPNRARPNRRPSKPNRRKPLEPTRIVGGVEVMPPRKYPWQVLLLVNGRQQCGGSIIKKRWILTAAHCIYDTSCNMYSPDSFTVRVGEHNQADVSDDDPVNTITYNVISHEKHSGYICTVNPSVPMPIGTNNDFALLKLTRDIPFNNIIRPVCLPKDDMKDYAGDKATIAGWGKTSGVSSSSDVLREVDLLIDTQADCRWPGWNGLLPDAQLCAGPTGGKDSCSGDSGGPLVVKEGNTYIQVGVVSYGPADCGNPLEGSAMYARVSKVLNWIQRTTA